MPSKLLLRNIVQDIMGRHPKECIFVSDAVNVIVSRVDQFAKKEDIVNQIYYAFQDAEIYCPHEGIDRRNA